MEIEKRTSLYGRIRHILESARATVARSVNSTQVVANWLVGREIVEAEQRGQKRAAYGRKSLLYLAERLRSEYGAGYDLTNLKLFRKFYFEYPHLIESPKGYAMRHLSLEDEKRRKGDAARNESWKPGRLNPNLSWTHYRRLIRVDDQDIRSFYEIEVFKSNWSSRELERQINSLLYERLAKSRDKKGLLKLATKGHEIQKPADVFKDPIVMEFLGMPESPRLVESTLEKNLINNIQAFLLELGKGFAFVARQERITLDGDHFYVDLVFYHTVLKCYVLIDLKAGKLTHADLGQLQLYVNYYDQERRVPGDNSTLGLILCTDKNDAVVRYMLGPQQKKIFASRYKLHLPTESELTREIRRELAMLHKRPV